MKKIRSRDVTRVRGTYEHDSRSVTSRLAAVKPRAQRRLRPTVLWLEYVLVPSRFCPHATSLSGTAKHTSHFFSAKGTKFRRNGSTAPEPNLLSGQDVLVEAGADVPDAVRNACFGPVGLAHESEGLLLEGGPSNRRPARGQRRGSPAPIRFRAEMMMQLIHRRNSVNWPDLDDGLGRHAGP
jgi:hypothetical protein